MKSFLKIVDENKRKLSDHLDGEYCIQGFIFDSFLFIFVR